MRLVLQKLRSAKLYAKFPKCAFAKSEVDFLGHILTGEGIKTDPKKIEAVGKWPVLKTVKDIRSFLGLVPKRLHP